MAKSDRSVRSTRQTGERPVLQFRVHSDVYEALKKSAKQRKLTISEDAAKRIVKTLAMDEEEIEQATLIKAGDEQFLIGRGYQKVRDDDEVELWVKGRGGVAKWTALGPELEAIIERVVTRVLEKKSES